MHFQLPFLYKSNCSYLYFPLINKLFELFVFPSSSLGQTEYLHDRYGKEIFLERDEYGHSPAHWMALNGHVGLARYIWDSTKK